MKAIQSYQCEICEKMYTTRDEAIRCELKGRNTVQLKVGQKVLLKNESYSDETVVYREAIVTKVNDRGHDFSIDVDVYAYGWESYQGVTDTDYVSYNFNERIIVVPN